MIYTLTLNPALDYDMYLEDTLDVGEMNLCKKVNYRAGGKGINVSKMLKNLSIDSIALGYIGGFIGDFILKDLEINDINHDFIKLNGVSRINVKVNGKDIETELMGISPSISKKEINDLIEKFKKLESGDILVLSGSIPEDIENDIYKQISQHVKSDVEIVLDTRGKLIETNLYNNLLIKPNINELREMFNSKLETKREIINKCQYFLEKGVKNVIVSCGGDGAILINKDIVLEANVPKGKLINSVGAGDSMVAGFIAGINNKLSLEDSFKLAVASGSATAYSYNLGEKELVDKLFKEIEILKERV